MPPKLGLAIGIPGKGDDDDDEHNDTLSASFSLGQNGTLKAGSMEIKPDGLTRHGYEHYKISAEHLRTVKTLGTGASSVVHKALLVQENKFVAVKKIKLFEKELRKQMMNDIKALSDATNHPGLVSFFGAFHSPDLGEIAIVLEYMDGGSLADVLRKVKRIPEPHLAHITHRILQGLLELHRRHMVHRDIKPANILMNLKGEAKISDFGISKFFDQTMAMCLTYVGTVTYMSPERIKNQNYSYPADIWSVGLTLIECATGKYPYDATVGPLQLMMEIDASPVPLPPPGHFSEEFRDFVSKCMQKDPQKRPGASELLQHPFIVRYLPMNVDLRSFMKLAVDPNDKWYATAAIARNHGKGWHAAGRARLNEVCTTFAFGYYHLLQQGGSAIETMMPLYLDYSKVTYEGDTCEGREAIQGKLQQVVLMHKAFGKVEFDVINVDCQALADGSALLMLQGVMRPVSMPLDSTAFTETFVLRQTQRSEIYVSNQNFRLLPKPH